MDSGNRVDDLFDNRHMMPLDESLDMVKVFFKTELHQFIKDDEYIVKTGHWGLSYLFKNIKAIIGFDRGSIAHEIFVDGKKISLLEYEPLIKNVKTASKKNFRFILEVIKRYITGFVGESKNI